MANEKKLVGRHKRVAFMDTDGSGETFTRMTGFTFSVGWKELNRVQPTVCG